MNTDYLWILFIGLCLVTTYLAGMKRAQRRQDEDLEEALERLINKARVKRHKPKPDNVYRFKPRSISNAD